MEADLVSEYLHRFAGSLAAVEDKYGVAVATREAVQLAKAALEVGER